MDKISETDNTITYQLYLYKGINDLKRTTRTRFTGGEWGYDVDNFPGLTDEEAEVEIQKNKEWNDTYIKQLKESNQYGKKVKGIILTMEKSSFDDKQYKIEHEDSYKIVFIDISKNPVEIIKEHE